MPFKMMTNPRTCTQWDQKGWGYNDNGGDDADTKQQKEGKRTASKRLQIIRIWPNRTNTHPKHGLKSRLAVPFLTGNYVIPLPLSYKLKNSEGNNENEHSDLMMSKLCVEPSHTMILFVPY